MNPDTTTISSQPSQRPLSRRSMIVGSAALGAAGAFSAAGLSTATAAPETTRAFTDVERRYHRRIGVYARNLRTGRTLVNRPDERVGLCSTFKVVAAAAVLSGRLITPSRDALQRRLPYPRLMIPADMHAPAAQRWFREGHIPTLAEACEAAIADSDNAAVNLIMQQTGGPESITEYFRSVGDQTSRLDRWEVEMSSFEPGDPRDTSTPRALARTFVTLLEGTALRPRDRHRLRRWMAANRTNPPFAQNLPTGWTLLDKTGSGLNYGTRNDVGIAWTPAGVPIVVSCLTRADDPEAESLNAPLTDVFDRCIRELA